MSEPGPLPQHSAPILTSPGASGDKRAPRGRSAAPLAALVLLGLLAGCGPRPVGDFGRAAPSVLHDAVLPAAGGLVADMRGAPLSDFNQTDAEREMHQRIWRFLIAPHAGDWFGDLATELQRTRILPANAWAAEVDRYYVWLSGTPHQSSGTRYRTLTSHVMADIDTLPATFEAICAVEAVDRQRATALATLGGLHPEMRAEAERRRTENEAAIGWFAAALDYRLRAYNHALDHLLVETPHADSLAADRALARLAPFVEQARRGAYCGAGQTGPGWGGVAIPSRYERDWRDTEVIAIK